jgi:hypothetical protein
VIIIPCKKTNDIIIMISNITSKSHVDEYSLKPKPYYLTPNGKLKWRSEIRRQMAKID